MYIFLYIYNICSSRQTKANDQNDTEIIIWKINLLKILIEISYKVFFNICYDYERQLVRLYFWIILYTLVYSSFYGIHLDSCSHLHK